jgi:phasin family protein
MAAKPAFESPFNLDFSKYLGDFKFPMDFKMPVDFKIPSFDFEACIAAQRKNVEALTQANRLAYDGLQAVTKRQIEIVRQSLDQAAQAVREVAEPGNAQDKAAKQTELAKVAFERALANVKELGELVSKANSEAFGLLQSRFTESLDEVRDQLSKTASK